MKDISDISKYKDLSIFSVIDKNTRELKGFYRVLFDTKGSDVESYNRLEITVFIKGTTIADYTVKCSGYNEISAVMDKVLFDIDMINIDKYHDLRAILEDRGNFSVIRLL